MDSKPLMFLIIFPLLPLQAQPQTTIDMVRGQLAWKTFEADMSMGVGRFGGSLLQKQIHVVLRETPHGQDLLMKFVAPANMRGTAFLALTRNDLRDRWYIYLRSLRRVKRLPPSPKNFMLRDFLSLYLLKPRPQLWKEQSHEEVTIKNKKYIKAIWVAASPKTRELTGYVKLEQLIDPANRTIVKTRFYGPGGRLLREQHASAFKQIKGIWIPTEFTTKDYEEKAIAKVKLSHIKLNEEVDPGVFTVRYLKSL